MTHITRFSFIFDVFDLYSMYKLVNNIENQLWVYSLGNLLTPPRFKTEGIDFHHPPALMPLRTVVCCLVT